VTQAGLEQKGSLLDFNFLMIYYDLDHGTLMPHSPWQAAQ
jgi:hypothetical protein